MKKFLAYREKDYFEQREGHYFLLHTLSPVMRVAKMHFWKGQYWLKTSMADFKATTVECVSLTDLAGTLVHYKDHPKVRGKLGGYGVSKTPFVYVYWYALPMKEPYPYSLPHVFDLVVENVN